MLHMNADLGLITAVPTEEESDSDSDEWQDYEEDSCESEDDEEVKYVIDTRRLCVRTRDFIFLYCKHSD